MAYLPDKHIGKEGRSQYRLRLLKESLEVLRIDFESVVSHRQPINPVFALCIGGHCPGAARVLTGGCHSRDPIGDYLMRSTYRAMSHD